MAEQRYQVRRRWLTTGEFRQSARFSWGIANQRHWVRDAAFAAEPCRARPGQAAAIGSVARPIALNLLRRETSRPGRGGCKAPGKRAGWDGDCLPKTLAG